jgi:dGTP triphosphohydrolase
LRELCASPVEEAFIDECRQFFEERVKPAARGYDDEDCCDVIIEAAGADLKGFEPDTLLELLKYVYLNKAYEGNKKRFVQHLARNGQIVKELFAALESTASALADIEAQRETAKNSDNTYRQVLDTLSGLEQQERELLESYEQTKQTLSQELPAPAPAAAPRTQSGDAPEGAAPKKRGRRPKDAPVPPDEPPEDDDQLLV